MNSQKVEDFLNREPKKSYCENDNFPLDLIQLFKERVGQLTKADTSSVKDRWVEFLSSIWSISNEDFLSLLVSYLWISKENFIKEFNVVYLCLKNSILNLNKHDIMSEILVCLLDNNTAFNKLKELNEKFKSNLLSVLWEILSWEKTLGDFDRIYVFWLIEILYGLWYFQKLPEKLYNIFKDFLEKELDDYMDRVWHFSNLLWYSLLKRFVVKNKGETSSFLARLLLLINNANTSNDPLIIDFMRFPWDNNKTLIFQEKKVFTLFKENPDITIFDWDKAWFLETVANFMKDFNNLLDDWEIFAISVYRNSWWKTRPPLIQWEFDKIAA